MTRCRLCLIPDTRPDTAFVDGACSACIAYANRPQIDWGEREQELRNLLARHRGRCIVPSSGGKDSTWQVLKLLELGAKPIAVTATTCHLTPIGRANIDNLAKYAETIEVTGNRIVRAKLNKIGLTMVGDISWPEHVSIHRVPFKIALRLGIPLIFYGECPTREYGGPPGSEHTRTMTQRWVSEFGGFRGLRPQDLIGTDGLSAEDLAYYMGPSDAELMEQDINAYFLGQFIEWDSQRNAEVAREAGMLWSRPSYANWWPYENLDNAQTGIHDHVMYRKFGYGRLVAQLSIDIRRGAITREEALPIAQARDGLFPMQYAGVAMEEILRRIGMSIAGMRAAMEQFTNWDLFEEEVEGRPILKEWA